MKIKIQEAREKYNIGKNLLKKYSLKELEDMSNKHTLNEIANLVGFSTSTVGNVFIKYGIKLKSGPRKDRIYKLGGWSKGMTKSTCKSLEHSLEWNRKIGDKNRGKKRTEYVKNNKKIQITNLWLDTKYKNKQIESHKGGQNSLSKVGCKNPNWQGGISFEVYPRGFNKVLKEQIRNRDGRICQLCGKPEVECNKKLIVHHIDYDKKNCEENNLISLCNSHNVKVNTNREHWKQYFITLMMEKYGVIKTEDNKYDTQHS